MCIDIFINCILNSSDKKVLTNAYFGLGYLIEREDAKEKVVARIIKENIINQIFKLDLLFHMDAVNPAIKLIFNMLNLSLDYVEVYKMTSSILLM